MMNKRQSLLALIFVAVMLFTTVSVNAAELAYGSPCMLSAAATYVDVLAAQAREEIIVASRAQMNSLLPASVNDTCLIEVTLTGYQWIETRDGAVTTGELDHEPPASVRVMEPDSDHFHQGYLTSWYAAPTFEWTNWVYISEERVWRRQCDAEVVFYGYLECLCW